MDFGLDRSKINMSGEQIMRRAGYGLINDHHTGKNSFVRRLSQNHYPRLHMYVKEEAGRIIFSLHLDQKQASYQGSHMHNAEYQGAQVEQEVERLRQVVIGLVGEQNRVKAAAIQASTDTTSKWYQFWK